MAQITITVIEVDIKCQKCKTKVLQAVASVEGVDKVVADEGKGTIEVTGTADSCFITKRIKKALSCTGKTVKLVKIGPPPKPEKKPDQTTKPEEKPRQHPCPCPYPCPCPPCPWSYGYVVVAPETNTPCSIL